MTGTEWQTMWPQEHKTSASYTFCDFLLRCPCSMKEVPTAPLGLWPTSPFLSPRQAIPSCPPLPSLLLSLTHESLQLLPKLLLVNDDFNAFASQSFYLFCWLLLEKRHPSNKLQVSHVSIVHLFNPACTINVHPTCIGVKKNGYREVHCTTTEEFSKIKEEVPPWLVDTHLKNIAEAKKEGTVMDETFGLDKTGIAGTVPETKEPAGRRV